MADPTTPGNSDIQQADATPTFQLPERYAHLKELERYDTITRLKGLLTDAEIEQMGYADRSELSPLFMPDSEKSEFLHKIAKLEETGRVFKAEPDMQFPNLPEKYASLNDFDRYGSIERIVKYLSDEDITELGYESREELMPLFMTDGKQLEFLSKIAKLEETGRVFQTEPTPVPYPGEYADYSTEVRNHKIDAIISALTDDEIKAMGYSSDKEVQDLSSSNLFARDEDRVAFLEKYKTLEQGLLADLNATLKQAEKGDLSGLSASYSAVHTHFANKDGKSELSSEEQQAVQQAWENLPYASNAAPVNAISEFSQAKETWNSLKDDASRKLAMLMQQVEAGEKEQGAIDRFLSKPENLTLLDTNQDGHIDKSNRLAVTATIKELHDNNFEVVQEKFKGLATIINSAIKTKQTMVTGATDVVSVLSPQPNLAGKAASNMTSDRNK